MNYRLINTFDIPLIYSNAYISLSNTFGARHYYCEVYRYSDLRPLHDGLVHPIDIGIPESILRKPADTNGKDP